MRRPAYYLRAKRTRGMHQRGRDLLARRLRALPHSERAAAHAAWDVAPHRYDTTNYPQTRADICLRFATIAWT